jgi:hypothetical protein
MPKPPFSVADLPDTLEPVMNAALKSDYYGEAIEALEETIRASDDYPPATLVALAFCIYEHALTVMIDEVAPYSQQALDLLMEANERGVKAKDIASMRRRIQKTLQQEQQRQQAIDALLNRPIDELQIDQVIELAQSLGAKGGAKNIAAAGNLWQVAVEKLKQTDTSLEAQQRAFSYMMTAAFKFADAGQFDKALPVLQPVMDQGIANPWHTYTMVEHAYYRFLDYAIVQEDRDRFRALWGRAAQHLPGSPLVRPKQDAYLKVCVRWNLPDECARILAIIERQERPAKTISPEIKQVIIQARALIANT